MGDSFSTAVEAIYDAAPDPSRWPMALQAIANVFDDVGANLLWRKDDQSFGVIVSPGLESSMADYQANWWSCDIRASRSSERLALHSGWALTDRHVASPDEIENHPIYTDFLARHGLKWVAGTFISPNFNTFVSLNVQRSLNKPPFSDHELDTLVQLGAVAEKSLRLSLRLLDTELSNLGLTDALARIGVGVFALDSLGRVVFLNAAAERLLGVNLSIRDGKLRIADSSSRPAIEAAIRRALSVEKDAGQTVEPLILHRSSSERPLVFYLLPISSAVRPVEQFLTQTRAILLVIDPKAGEPADPALVRDVFGLTLGEARVAALVGSGLPPREAAVRLGIGEETARTALKRVFSKVGVSRQSELTALLTRLVLR
ncbi:MAG: helix-turn-helix transcriptional regulator [Rhodopseudomonas sp.]|uniref:helix-turn-helix transcriptional regulator n=1 Tax=Rhodopseudomonas sp. TaxID=1078 RepID=UPI00180211DA|nr:helix-turn-helix transcriptional regulator [Rhodopseudomonas sp.]NVN87288.1 helix-turn-helix transcriptional regulator [Rhodopseudomonas sp.]